MSTNSKQINLVPAIVILLIIIILVVIGSLYAFHHEDVPIQGQADVTEYRVSSKVPGRIKKYLVDEGQFVHKGDTLAILEAPEVNAKLQQAEAAVTAASAQNEKAEHGARTEQIQAAYDLWQKAKVGVDFAKKSYARIKKLADEQVVTAQKLDEITAKLNAAISTEKAAKSQYDMAKKGAREEDKIAAKALVKRAEGAVREVDSYLNETCLVASDDGVVSEIFPQIGELVGPGAPIMTVSMMNKMWISFNVREDCLKNFSMGKVLSVSVPALNNKVIKAKVYYMKDLGSYAEWRATKSTGQFDMKTFEVRLKPIDKIEGLYPGMSVLLEINK